MAAGEGCEESAHITAFFKCEKHRPDKQGGCSRDRESLVHMEL